MKAIRRSLFTIGMGGAALCAPLASQALTFEFGDISASLDTTVSVGASMRTEDAQDSLVGIANGGTSRSVNDDDGNLNYESGDLVSAVIKATHDVELRYGQSGIFARTSYFYDAQADSDREYFGKRGKDRLVSEITMLDLFYYANFRLDGKPATIRLGNQVVNWGESTFIQNGINAANPVDVAKLRTPGSELKEALLPVPMFWGSASLSNSLSLEAMWIWNFKEIEIDPRGSFFSTNDFLSDDGTTAYTGFGRRNDQHNNTAFNGANTGVVALGVPRTFGMGEPERKADQYGFALRYFADWLNSTEFGLYYTKYHSRIPLVSVLRATNQASTPARVLTSAFYADYPEDIELYGLSFNTDGPFGIALQGEYSYRPNLPVQLAATEVLLAGLRLPNTIDAAEGVNSATAPTQFDGFRRTAAHQAQITATKAFGPTFGANQFVILAEAAVNKLELDKDLLFNGPGAGLPSCNNPAAAGGILVVLSNGSCQEDVGGGYMDRTSWGYRLVSGLTYENAIGAASLSPRLVFAHDVNGVGPNFNQDAKAITAGVGMNYLQRWQAELSYTTFFDGRNYSGTDPFPPGTPVGGSPIGGDATQSQSFNTSANPNEDRDFVSLNISYAF